MHLTGEATSTYNAAMSEQQQVPMVSEPLEEPQQHDGDTLSVTPADSAEAAATIAARLGETEAAPCAQIRRAVKVLGAEAALALLQETMEIEAGEGLMLADGSRRRTAGGVFFHLIRTKTPRSLRGRIFPAPPKQRKGTSSPPPGVRESPPRSGPSAPAAPPVFIWNERIAAVEEIGAEKGRATTVKITLIGQPGKVMDRGACIVTSMQHTGEKMPALPKGVPTPPAQVTTYTVYISAKQWKTVAAAASDPEDMLIVEGFPQLDSQTASIAVFASNVTSKKLQQAKRTAG